MQNNMEEGRIKQGIQQGIITEEKCVTGQKKEETVRKNVETGRKNVARGRKQWKGAEKM